MNFELKRAVLIRVRTIYLLRQLTRPLFIKATIFAALLVAFVSTVSVSAVIGNLLSSLEANGNAIYFFTSAFSESMLAVKLIFVAEIIVVSMLLKDALNKLPLGSLRMAKS